MSSDNAEITVGKLLSRRIPGVQLYEAFRRSGCADTTRDAAERLIAERSVLIKNMMDDIGDTAGSETIPIPNVRHNPDPLCDNVV